MFPGLLLAGPGAGLAFPAASITALSSVREGAEGLASGLLTTGHEVGAALGAAAALPAVRPASGARVSFHSDAGRELTSRRSRRRELRHGAAARSRVVSGRNFDIEHAFDKRTDFRQC